MKKSTFILGSMLMIFASCTQAPQSDEATTSEAKDVANAEGTTLTVDPSASTVKWIGTKISGYHVGTIPVKSGSLIVSDGNITGGSFVLDMAGLAVTGPEGSKPESNAKLLGHMKTGDFFDVEKYPEARFELTSVSPFAGTVQDENDPRQEDISEYKIANPTHTVSGNLTIKDKTKNVEFPAQITVSDNSADARAKFNIDRKQWDISYAGQPDDLIKDQVHIGLSIKAGK